MQFLIDEDLPRSTGDLLRSYGHKAIDVRDIGLRGAKDSQIASYAQSRDLCLVTGDFDFSGSPIKQEVMHFTWPWLRTMAWTSWCLGILLISSALVSEQSFRTSMQSVESLHQ